MFRKLPTGTEMLVKNPYGMKLGFNNPKISPEDFVLMTAWLERVFGVESIDKIRYKEGVPQIVVELKRKWDVSSKLGTYAWAEFLTRRSAPRENTQHTQIFLFNRKDVDLEQQGFSTHYPNANANPRNFSVANQIPPPKWCSQPTMWNNLQWAKPVDQRKSATSLEPKGTQLDVSAFIRDAVREVRPTLLSLSSDWLLDDAFPRKGQFCCRILGTLSSEYAQYEEKACVVNSVFTVNSSIAATARVTITNSDVTLPQIPLEYLRPLRPQSVRETVVVLRGEMKGNVFQIIGYDPAQCVLSNLATDDSQTQVLEVPTNNLSVYHPPPSTPPPAAVSIRPLQHLREQVESIRPYLNSLSSSAQAQVNEKPAPPSVETSSPIVKLEAETPEELQKRRFDEICLHYVVLYNPIGLNHRNLADLSQVKAWLQSQQLFGEGTVESFYVRPLYPQIIVSIRTSLSIILPSLGLHFGGNCIVMCPMPLKNVETYIFLALPELRSEVGLHDKGYRRLSAGNVKDLAPQYDYEGREEALKYVVDDVDPPDLKLWQWTDAERIEDSWGEFGTATEHPDVVVKSDPDGGSSTAALIVKEEDPGNAMDIDNSIPRIKLEPGSESFQQLDRPSPAKKVKAVHEATSEGGPANAPGDRLREVSSTAGATETGQPNPIPVPNEVTSPTLTAVTNGSATNVPRTGIFRKSESGGGGTKFPLDLPVVEQETSPSHPLKVLNSSDPRLRDPKLQAARVRVKEEPME